MQMVVTPCAEICHIMKLSALQTSFNSGFN